MKFAILFTLYIFGFRYSWVYLISREPKTFDCYILLILISKMRWDGTTKQQEKREWQLGTRKHLAEAIKINMLRVPTGSETSRAVRDPLPPPLTYSDINKSTSRVLMTSWEHNELKHAKLISRRVIVAVDLTISWP